MRHFLDQTTEIIGERLMLYLGHTSVEHIPLHVRQKVDPIRAKSKRYRDTEAYH